MKVRMVSYFGFPARGVSPYATRLSESLEATDGIALERFPIAQAFPNWLNPAKQPGLGDANGLHYAQPNTWQACVAGAFDVLHLQYWSPALAPCYWWIARKARAEGKSIVITVHNPAPHESIPLFDWVESALLKSADALIVHSRQGLEILGVRFPHSRVISIHHGVDVYRNVGDGRARSMPMGLLFFGNLRPYKGVDSLIRAWMTLKDEYPDSSLTIAGRSWEGQNACSRLVSRLLFRGQPMDEPEMTTLARISSNRIRLIKDYLAEEEIDRLCLTSRIGVFPYVRFTGQSGAAGRAAGMGLPVLVSDTGALPDFAVTPEFIVPPGDTDQLENAIRTAMRIDGDEYWELRRRQRNKAASMSWISAAGKHEEVYVESLRCRL